MGRLSSAQKFGLKGEIWALEQLKTLGYQAQLISGFFANIDIMLESLLPVEVKIASQTLRQVRAGYHRPCWQFDLSRCLPTKRDWLLIAICEDERGRLWPYVIYSGFLAGRSTRLQITSHPAHYSGWCSSHLNNWSLVSEVLSRRRQQAGQLYLPLFQEASYV